MKSILNATLSLLTVMAVLNGCESNTGFENAAEYAKIYMPQARQQPAEFSFLMADTAYTIIYGAAYGGPDTPASDIEVRFSVDSSLVDSFNTARSTSYAVMPEAGYELSQTTAIIPAGKVSTEPLGLKITTIGAIQPVIEYLLPVSIEVSGSTEINAALQTTYFLIQGTFVEFDRAGWEIIDVDSEQEGAFPATNLLDGDPGTFWHTQYSPVRPPLPHHVSIDLGETKQIHGVRIIGRQGFTRGDPEEIVIEVSSDGENWVNGETFTTTFDTVNENTFYLSATREGRYIKLTVMDSFGEAGLPITHFAEAYAF